MNPNLNNTVVLSLNPEHGAEIIKAWNSLGVDTGGAKGTSTWWPYYGMINGKFGCEDQFFVTENSLTIITLLELQAMAEPQQPERTFPREMEVSHNNKNWAIRTVLLYDKDTYFAVDKSDEKRFKRNRNFFCITWKYAREIE